MNCHRKNDSSDQGNPVCHKGQTLFAGVYRGWHLTVHTNTEFCDHQCLGMVLWSATKG